MATPDDLQAQVSAVPWNNAKGLVTGATLLGLLSTIIGILYTMGTWGPAGYTPNIPNGSITQAMLAQGVGSTAASPPRVVTNSGAISTSVADALVCLNGPTEVDLEASPPSGTRHVLKDCRSSAGAPIAVVPTGSTIDGLASYSMTNQSQSITVTFTPLGWIIS